ncbi:MAG: CRISPR-associated endonuclease Cas2 [Helicobacteraceae bacterium]|jgi:CRISPR-associated protein Cas2|nr:CRISPR-associated endonuclease Cas2 [Helicobacteraceae bacterium]
MRYEQGTFFLRTPSKNRFIVCYDITDEKRLSKVANRVEKVCLRIQRSVYYAEWSDMESLQEILQSALDQIDPTKDDFRIYEIYGKTYALHAAIDIDNPCILS